MARWIIGVFGDKDAAGEMLRRAPLYWDGRLGTGGNLAGEGGRRAGEAGLDCCLTFAVIPAAALAVVGRQPAGEVSDLVRTRGLDSSDV